ncbi:phosphocholine cytidylyltransferase family protein [Cetobacterium sp.]|uniref:phosphocholine cytidylyltransferase family protein n=1 Tax=Cetobacterium sp. TaxID=2071632 RepID=UPI002FC9DA95
MKTAVILAAGMGTRLRSITNNEIPKPFLEINGKSLIERSIENLQDSGIDKIIIVVGHLKDFFEKLKTKYSGIILVENIDYATTSSMASFYCAKHLIEEDLLLLEGDLIYEKLGLKELISFKERDAILLSEDKKNSDDYYYELLEDRITSTLKHELTGKEEKIGELTGINKISKELYFEMCKLFENKKNPKLGYEYCLAELAEKIKIPYLLLDGFLWSEIDDEFQLNKVIKTIYPEIQKKGEV